MLINILNLIMIIMKNFINQSRQNLDKLFFEYIHSYSGAFTDCNTLRRWIQDDKELNTAQSIEDFKQVMETDDYFEQRHFRKVDIAFEHFKDKLCMWAAGQNPHPSDISE